MNENFCDYGLRFRFLAEFFSDARNIAKYPLRRLLINGQYRIYAIKPR